MKKTITLLLTLCLLLGLLPTEAVAYLGDIQTVDSGTVTAKKLNSGSWELRNDYLRVIVRKDGTLSTAPAADSAGLIWRREPSGFRHSILCATGAKNEGCRGETEKTDCARRLSLRRRAQSFLEGKLNRGIVGA